MDRTLLRSRADTVGVVEIIEIVEIVEVVEVVLEPVAPVAPVSRVGGRCVGRGGAAGDVGIPHVGRLLLLLAVEASTRRRQGREAPRLDVTAAADARAVRPVVESPQRGSHLDELIREVAEQAHVSLTLEGLAAQIGVVPTDSGELADGLDLRVGVERVAPDLVDRAKQTGPV